MERRLGRGLGSLLGGSASKVTTSPTAAGSASQGSGLDSPSGAKEAADSGGAASRSEGPESGPQATLAVDQIRPNPHQPRVRFDEAALEGLRDSIAQHGVIQAIAVRRGDAGYELISGERRLKACKMAGLDTIPVIIHENVTEDQSLEWALVENLQREDLDPIERAKGFREMMTRLNLKQEEVAQRVGLKRSTVTNHLRLLELPGEVQDAVIQGLLSMGHARSLAGLSSEAQQLELMSKVVRQAWSVRQLEASIRNLGSSADSGAVKEGRSQAANPTGHRPSWVMDVEARMRESLGTQVVVHHQQGGTGKIMIRYHDTAELNRVLDLVAPRSLI